MWTDSSSYGWGCVYDQLEASGIWDCETIYEHINFKELLTVLYALNELAESIWALALSENIQIRIIHIAGASNDQADHLSRLSQQYEWQLHPGIFSQLDDMWGPHTMDRFASLSTAQLQTYNSRYLDPWTSGVDASSNGLIQTQLCESTISYARTYLEACKTSKSLLYSHRPTLAQSSVVPVTNASNFPLLPLTE